MSISTGGGLHIIDRDAARAEVAGQAFGQADEADLLMAYGAIAAEGHAVGVGAVDVDDAPTLLHMARGFLACSAHANLCAGRFAQLRRYSDSLAADRADTFMALEQPYKAATPVEPENAHDHE